MPSPEKISGYQLAEHLLAEGGMEALLRYAGNAETDWLELKAGMCLLPEDKKKGETEKDLYWNIAKEVIALMNTSGGALVIGIHDKTLNLVPLEENDPRHILAEKGIDGYVREFVRSNVWPSSLSWTYRGKTWELADKQVPTDLISYHHALYSGPDGRTGEVVVLLVKPSEKIRLAKEDRKSSVLLKRTRGEVGEAVPIYDYDEFDKYKTTREIESAFYANVRDQFDREHAAASESAKLDAAIQNYYSGLAVKARKMMAVFTSLDAEENVFSKDDVDQFYSPEAIETFDDEDRWLDDDEEEEDREDDEEEDEEDSDFDEGALDSEDDTEDEEDARSARKGDLLELLKSEQRVIVSGEPGGGKTTCLTYFTLKFAERGDDVPILAVFIPMGQWRRGGSLRLMMERATGMDAGQLAHVMSENRLRLVIDAVNECPDDFRVAAIQNIGMFLAEHPTVPAVISTRHPKELAALHLPVFHVQPMDETHRLRYLERYLQDGEQAQKLLHQLGDMPGGETVAENPMLLRLVVEVYKESPEKRLPNGRAGLYRRSLRAWYKRENEKAEKAGEKLQWNRRQTFELLAVLAFKSRQCGYRDVPLDEISAIWGADAENQLEVLCQGPIIYCDDEFVRFRHETFQEYLSAEYLVAHQDELPTWTQNDYAQWGMPFAYAVELFELDKQQLPESFWLAAWSLNPWLGVALTDESVVRNLLNPGYRGIRPKAGGTLLDIYFRAICGTFEEGMFRWALKDKDFWYKHEDGVLRYVVFVSQSCQSRWNNFEKSQLKCLEGLGCAAAIKLSKSWLTLSNPRNIFQYYAPNVWDVWINKILSPDKVDELIDAKIALPEDFSANKERWCGKIQLGVALRLFSWGILDRQDIEKMLPSLLVNADVKAVARLTAIGCRENTLVVKTVRRWIFEATPRTAIELITNGLATKDDFKSRMLEWISEATPRTVIELITNGLATKDDFKSRLFEWRKDKSISSAIFLVRAGLVSKAGFEGVLQTWISFATPQMAYELIEVGLMLPSDFSNRLSGWLQHSQYSFVQKFLKVSGELNNIRNNTDVVQRWIAAASIDSAACLITDGLATNEDFEDKKSEWLVFSNERQYRRMLQLHLISKQEFSDFENKLLAMRQACNDIERGKRSPSDFTLKKNIWFKSANLLMLVRLVQAGVIAKKDLDGQIKLWLGNSTPESALCLVKQHLAEAKDFDRLVPVWKPLLEPDVAKNLIEEKIICEEDILDVKSRWRANVEPRTLEFAIQLGCVTSDEAVEYLRVWGDVGLNRIQIGQVVHGYVKNITGFGAFIDLGGIDGLLHITDMSWSRIKHPSDMLMVGQELEVMVLDVDREKERISLGLKQITENPWDTIVEKFPVGSRLKGKVVNLAAYGVFVEIAPGIEGLVHISEFSWTKRVARASDMLNIGDEVLVSVLSVDAKNQKIALSIRQTQENPWDTVKDRYPVGSRVKGKVRNFTNYGAFIELEDGIDGMIHISGMSWTRKINRPSECLNKGDEVEAIVEAVNPKEQRISLSLKKAQTDPWAEIASKYPIGKLVKGKVSKIASFGAFIELEDGLDGLVHISQISDDRVTHVKDVLTDGQEVVARVIKVDTVTRRIGLSIKAISMTDDEVNILKNDNEGGLNSDKQALQDEGKVSSSIFYRKSIMIDPIQRQRIESELKNVRWDMIISYISKDRDYLFFAHSQFPDGVYCPVRMTKYHDIFEIGQTWSIKVFVNQTKKDGTWGFIARSVKPSKQSPVCLPQNEKPKTVDVIAISKLAAPPVLFANSTCNSLKDKLDGMSDGKGVDELMMNKLDLSYVSHLSIYIDETWPGTQDHAYENIGVIGGVVVPWEGVDEKRLSVVKTHLDNGSAARNAIQTMLRQSEVFPFVFPIKWDHAVGAGGRQYFELVQHALMLLLGWMLPQRDQPTTVDVFLEHISGYMDGHNETDFINSLTQAMRLLSGGRRFANWQIRRVEWVDKEFGYVPYGDLVCKTCVPREEQQLLAREVKVREWEGFLPFSKDVFPLLRDMDTASPSGLADLLISFAKVAQDTPFFRRVRKLAIDRAKADEAVCTALISRFEECYARPDRDMALLNRVVPHFLNEFPPDLFKERPRLQLLRILIGFQHANHNGDPDLATALVDQYHSLRPRILELDRDLCAYSDMNLAVHHHDSFDFDKALSLVDGWINDPLFPALSVMNRGRMYSSRGQSLALLGRNREADEAFSRALSIFSAEPELLASDIAQTKTYQAMNALDYDAPSAMPLVEGLLGRSLIAMAFNLTALLERPFAAHLFLKTLWRMREGRSVVQDALIKNLPADIAFRQQHPYELILFYLALLTKEANPSYAKACVREMEQFFEAIEFGGTLGLIHAYMRVMLKRHGLNVATDKEFFGELDIVEQYLTKAGTIITKLRTGWNDGTIPVEGILPFNYC